MLSRWRNSYEASRPQLEFTPSVVPAQLGRDRVVVLPDAYPDEVAPSDLGVQTAFEPSEGGVSATMAAVAPAARSERGDLPLVRSGLGWPNGSTPQRWEQRQMVDTITLP